MIDGVKLLCNLSPTDWTNNKDLSFHSWINASTGEIFRNNRHSNIYGLHLSIKEGETDTYCNVRGSLPKYYTKGKTNAIDYTFSDFLHTCKELEQSLKIYPKYATMQNVEFGANLILPFYCSIVFESVKSYKKYAYSPYTKNGKILGIVFKLQQYSIKIYDKGLQETGKKSQMMRFEIAVNKMVWINRRKKEKNRLQLNIRTLADMQSKEVWAELTKELIIIWDSVIFVDNYLNYKEMTNHEQKKYLHYRDIHYWTNLNNKQYCLAKQHLNKLQSLYSVGENKQQIILDLITDKCLTLLTTEKNENGNELTEINISKKKSKNIENEQHLKKQKRKGFNYLDNGLNMVDIPHAFLLENKTKAVSQKIISDTNTKTPKKSNCINCKKNLTEKKSNTKFCSVKCKNQYNERERTKANKKKREDEKEQLKKVTEELSKTDLKLLIIYKADGMQYADYLQQTEINSSLHWIKQIQKVVLINNNKNAQPVEFTTLRARALVREISKINSKMELKKAKNQ